MLFSPGYHVLKPPKVVISCYKSKPVFIVYSKQGLLVNTAQKLFQLHKEEKNELLNMHHTPTKENQIFTNEVPQMKQCGTPEIPYKLYSTD